MLETHFLRKMKHASLQWLTRRISMLTLSIVLMFFPILSYAETSVGPIPNGTIDLTIWSTSAVLYNYSITAGNSGNQYLDSLIPMAVTDSDNFAGAQFGIQSTQTVTITFSSDAPIGQHTNQSASFTFTSGIYFVAFNFDDVTGPDNDCNMTIQKFDASSRSFGPSLLSVTQKCYSYGHAYFRTDGADGILQTVEGEDTTRVVKPFTIPNGNALYGLDLFAHPIICSPTPADCRGMKREIDIGGYGIAELETTNGLTSVSKTVSIPPYDKFVFTGNALYLQVTHTREYLAPTIDPISGPAPITYRDGIRTIQLEDISNGNPNVTEGLSVSATSSNPDVIPSPSINYHSGDSTGTVSYYAAQGMTGSAEITVTVTADGGTPNYPQDDRSTPVSFTVRVLASKPCDDDRCFVYVGQRDDGLVDVIDATTNQIVNTIQVSLLGGLELAMTPDGSRIYAIGFSGGPSHLSIIDTETSSEIGIVALAEDASALAISPDGGQVYVAVPTPITSQHDVVSVVNTATNMVIKTIDIGDKVSPDGLAFSPDGATAYITTDSGNILVLDTIRGSLVATIGVGAGPHYLAVAPDGGRVYVVNRDSDNVSVIDTATNQVIRNIAVDDRPEGIAVTPDGRRAYVASRVSAFNGRLEVIDTSTNTVTGTIFLNGRNGPKKIAITPDGTRAYVTFETDLAVSEIATATNQVVQTVSVGTPTIGIVISGLPLSKRSLGDINRDGSINQNDLSTLLSDRNKTVNGSACGLACDLDGDGVITVLDARRLATLCARPGCATR